MKFNKSFFLYLFASLFLLIFFSSNAIFSVDSIKRIILNLSSNSTIIQDTKVENIDFEQKPSLADELSNSKTNNLSTLSLDVYVNNSDKSNLDYSQSCLTSDCKYLRSNDPPSKKILGGSFFFFQEYMNGIEFNVLSFFLFSIVIFLSILFFITKIKIFKIFYLSTCSLLSIIFSFRLSEGWDELFINLKHSYNFLYHFTFSANQFERIEATVDLAPFLAITFISFITKLPLPDSAILVSLSGNVLIIIFSYLLVKKILNNELPAFLIAFLLSIYPPIIFVGATGFMATLFTGMLVIFGYWHLALRGKWNYRSLVLLGLLPLFRIEAIVLCGVLLSRYYIKILNYLKIRKLKSSHLNRMYKIIFIYTIVTLGPFVLLYFFRWLYFGDGIPVPVTYKSANGDYFFLRGGVFWLLKTLILYKWHFLVPLIILTFIYFKIKFNTKIIFIILSLIILSLIYTSGGGDWFPLYWARYLMPLFVMFLILAICILFFAAKVTVNIKEGVTYKILYICFFIFTLLFLCLDNIILGSVSSSYFEKYAKYFVPLYAIFVLLTIYFVFLVEKCKVNVKGSISLKTIFNCLFFSIFTGAFFLLLSSSYKVSQGGLLSNYSKWGRMDAFSSLGQHLEMTSVNNSLIASSEMAAIMYHANRDLVDLLGIANIEVAKSDLNPLRPGDVLHRKRNPSVLKKIEPEFLIFFEAATPTTDDINIDNTAKFTKLLRDRFFTQDMIDVQGYRGGSIKNLFEIGYTPVIIVDHDYIFYYWVHKKVKQVYLKKLHELNYQFKRKVVVDYNYDLAAFIYKD